MAILAVFHRILYGKKTHPYVIVREHGTSLSIEAVDSEGQTIDSAQFGHDMVDAGAPTPPDAGRVDAQSDLAAAGGGSSASTTPDQGSTTGKADSGSCALHGRGGTGWPLHLLAALLLLRRRKEA